MERLRNENLLLVEPHPIDEQIREAATKAGWVLVTARGILRALQTAAAVQIDAVLLHDNRECDIAAAVEEFRRMSEPTQILVTAERPGFIPHADQIIVIPCESGYLRQTLENSLKNIRTRTAADELHAENNQLSVNFQLQTDRLAGVENAWARINQSLFDLQKLLETSIDLFSKAANSRRISLMLIDERNELRILASRGVPSEVVASTRVRVGEGVAGWVASRGRPLMARDDANMSPASGPPRDYSSDYFLSLPLKTESEMLGVINMTEREDRKPFNDDEIKRLIFLAEQTALWISHSKRLKMAERLTLIDELTSLYNRRHLMTELAREIGRSARTGGMFSVGMLDIDHFKIYNDKRGHQAGDELLRQLALVMRKNLRTTDSICRYGGDEFAVIMPGGDGQSPEEQDGAHFIDRLRKVISRFPFMGQDVMPQRRLTINGGGDGQSPEEQNGAHSIDRLCKVISRFPFMGLDVMPQRRLTISAGVAVFPHDGDDPAQLIGVADKRLFMAKSSGRNMVVSGASAGCSANESPRNNNKTNPSRFQL